MMYGMTLMERIIETVMERHGSEYLADALVSELIEWGAIPEDEGLEFASTWERLKGGN